MRVVGNYGTTLLDYLNKDKSIQEVLEKGVDGSALSAGARKTLEKYGISLNGSKGADTDKSIYNNIKNVTESLREDTLLLTDDSEKSLFAEAVSSGDRTDVDMVVDDFVKNYNTMLDAMSEMGGTSNTQYAKELSALVSGNKEALEAIGITADADGKLAIDQKKYQAAELEEIQKAFNGDYKFGDKVAKKSIYVTANALSAMYSSSVANYTNGAGYADSNTYSDAAYANFLKSI